MASDRVMPDPWFRAHSAPMTIESGFFGTGYRQANPTSGERQLARFILPPFQRPAVWSRAQQIAFLESIWAGLPLGIYVVNDDDRHKEHYPYSDWLLDGQQRWTCLTAYVEGDFEVHGWRYPDLPKSEQRRFMRREFTALITHLTSLEDCQDVYRRLAYGGTPHA